MGVVVITTQYGRTTSKLLATVLKIVRDSPISTSQPNGAGDPALALGEALGGSANSRGKERGDKRRKNTQHGDLSHDRHQPEPAAV